MMSQVSEQDVKAIREWLAKESYLPKNFSDNMLKKIIFSCFCSLEKTKKCIDKFCTTRANLPEVYTNRDPVEAKIQYAFSTINVSSYPAGVDEILIYQIHDVTDKFDFYGTISSLTLIADCWLQHELDQLYDGHIVIFDLKVYSMALLAKLNIFYCQKFIVFLLESMPVRLKQIHLINCPPIAEYIYNLIKPVLPMEIRNMVKFHATSDTLHEHVDKKYLPPEFGGDAIDITEASQYWVDKVMKQRDFLKNDNLWKADLTKKPKSANAEQTMNGSFRTLAID